MQDKVILKGKKTGLELYFNVGINFESLLELLEQKLIATGDFFAASPVQTKISLATECTLTSQQEKVLADLFDRYSLKYIGKLAVDDKAELTVADNIQKDTEDSSKSFIQNTNLNISEKEFSEQACLIIYKTLRGGQHISYFGSVVVIGDVNPGARIFAEGNITISGISRGILHAGALGDKNAVITAGQIAGGQLRIAEYIAIADENEIFRTKSLERAGVINDRIVIDDL